MLLLLVTVPCFAQESALNPSASWATKNCQQINVPDVGHELLTREEQIALLDKELLSEVSKPLCDLLGSGASAENGGSAGSDGSAGNGDSAGNGSSAGDSVASDRMEGDQPVAGAETNDNTSAENGDSAGDSVASDRMESDQPVAGAETNDNTSAASDQVSGKEAGGGEQSAGGAAAGKRVANLNRKLPEDIPSADNDDIIAKQFREAAIAETDPVTKGNLWNEYRRYKNLPTQPVNKS